MYSLSLNISLSNGECAQGMSGLWQWDEVVQTFRLEQVHICNRYRSIRPVHTLSVSVKSGGHVSSSHHLVSLWSYGVR